MRSVSGAASSLESDSSKGGRLINLYRVPFPFFFFFFFAFVLPSSFVMAKPPVSLPSFSHFAEVSSPFL